MTVATVATRITSIVLRAPQQIGQMEKQCREADQQANKLLAEVNLLTARISAAEDRHVAEVALRTAKTDECTRLAEQLASRSSVFRKLALRRSAEQHPGRVGSNVFGDNFRCLITSVHVDAMLGEPARPRRR